MDTAVWMIFAVTYILLAIGRVPGLALDRAGIAILGAVALLALDALSLSDAIRSVDFATIVLLYSLMIVSANLRLAGFYALAAQRVLRWTDRPFVVLTALVLASAILSSLFANDIVCLAFTPILCEALLAAGRDPLPYLIALATSSNIGSVATLIGNPQNMYIGEAGRLSFGHYSLLLSPVAAVGLVLNVLVVAFVYRRSLLGRVPGPDGARLTEAALSPVEIDRGLILKTLLVTAGLLGAFLLAERREVWALVAAAVLISSRRLTLRKIHALVDWNLIALFLGLFVVIGALKHRALLQPILAEAGAQGLDLREPWTLTGASLVLSNLVSNVPAVLLLQNAADGAGWRWWYILAASSTLAGNLTLLGSIANLIVAEQALPFGVRMGFWSYARVGIPLTILTLFLATLWLTLV